MDIEKVKKLLKVYKCICLRTKNKLSELLEEEEINFELLEIQVDNGRQCLAKLKELSDSLWSRIDYEGRDVDIEEDMSFNNDMQVQLKRAEKVMIKGLVSEPVYTSCINCNQPADKRLILEAKKDGYKIACDETVTKLEIEILSKKPQMVKIQVLVELIKKLLGKVESVSTQLLNCLKINDYSTEISAEAAYESKVREIVKKACKLLEIDHESKHSRLSKNYNMAISLPTLQLPKFDGTCTGWYEFWDVFCSAVDRHDLDEVNKLAYLKAQISGDAKQLIKHLPMTNNSYSLAVQILKATFENKLLMSLELGKFLDTLGSIEHSAESLSAFRADLAGLVGRFENLGCKVSGNCSAEMLLTSLLLTRMPQSLLEKLLRSIVRMLL